MLRIVLHSSYGTTIIPTALEFEKMKFENEFEKKTKKENFFQHFTKVQNIYTECI